MKIVIVDDDIFYRNKISQTIHKAFSLQKQKVFVEILSSGVQLLVSLEKHVLYDVYLLDVDMPDINGLELAGKIRQQDQTGYIIFITNYEKYALQGYKYHAYQYILKDHYKHELVRVLEQIYQELEAQESCYYVIQANNKYEKFPFKKIQYLVKEGKYIIFYCNAVEYKERATMEQVYERLPHDEFIYIDRGQIVNMNYVNRICQQEIELNPDKILHVSRSMMPEVKHRLAQYWSSRK